jgi:hypothetical protein
MNYRPHSPVCCTYKSRARSWTKLMVVWTVKELSTFYGNLKVSYRLHNNRPLVPNLSQIYPGLAPPHLNSLKLLSYPLTSFQVDSPFMIHNQNFVCISDLAQMLPLYPSLTVFPLRNNSYIIILPMSYSCLCFL